MAVDSLHVNKSLEGGPRVMLMSRSQCHLSVVQTGWEKERSMVPAGSSPVSRYSAERPHVGLRGVTRNCRSLIGHVLFTGH